jgi:Leucine-rich repeat (LRR) protein
MKVLIPLFLLLFSGCSWFSDDKKSSKTILLEENASEENISKENISEELLKEEISANNFSEENVTLPKPLPNGNRTIPSGVPPKIPNGDEVLYLENMNFPTFEIPEKSVDLEFSDNLLYPEENSTTIRNIYKYLAFKGVALDGYIKGGTPTLEGKEYQFEKTDENGVFYLFFEKSDDKEFLVKVSGGVNTATDEKFYGLLQRRLTLANFREVLLFDSKTFSLEEIVEGENSILLGDYNFSKEGNISIFVDGNLTDERNISLIGKRKIEIFTGVKTVEIYDLNVSPEELKLREMLITPLSTLLNSFQKRGIKSIPNIPEKYFDENFIEDNESNSTRDQWAVAKFPEILMDINSSYEINSTVVEDIFEIIIDTISEEIDKNGTIKETLISGEVPEKAEAKIVDKYYKYNARWFLEMLAKWRAKKRYAVLIVTRIYFFERKEKSSGEVLKCEALLENEMAFKNRCTKIESGDNRGDSTGGGSEICYKIPFKGDECIPEDIYDKIMSYMGMEFALPSETVAPLTVTPPNDGNPEEVSEDLDNYPDINLGDDFDSLSELLEKMRDFLNTADFEQNVMEDFEKVAELEKLKELISVADFSRFAELQRLLEILGSANFEKPEDLEVFKNLLFDSDLEIPENIEKLEDILDSTSFQNPEDLAHLSNLIFKTEDFAEVQKLEKIRELLFSIDFPTISNAILDFENPEDLEKFREILGSIDFQNPEELSKLPDILQNANFQNPEDLEKFQDILGNMDFQNQTEISNLLDILSSVDFRNPENLEKFQKLFSSMNFSSDFVNLMLDFQTVSELQKLGNLVLDSDFESVQNLEKFSEILFSTDFSKVSNLLLYKTLDFQLDFENVKNLGMSFEAVLELEKFRSMILSLDFEKPENLEKLQILFFEIDFASVKETILWSFETAKDFENPEDLENLKLLFIQTYETVSELQKLKSLVLASDFELLPDLKEKIELIFFADFDEVSDEIYRNIEIFYSKNFETVSEISNFKNLLFETDFQNPSSDLGKFYSLLFSENFETVLNQVPMGMDFEIVEDVENLLNLISSLNFEIVKEMESLKELFLEEDFQKGVSDLAKLLDFQFTEDFKAISDLENLKFILFNIDFEKVYDVINLKNIIFSEDFPDISSFSKYGTLSTLADFETVSDLEKYKILQFMINFENVSELEKLSELVLSSDFEAVSDLDKLKLLLFSIDFQKVSDAEKLKSLHLFADFLKVSELEKLETLIFAIDFEKISDVEKFKELIFLEDFETYSELEKILDFDFATDFKTKSENIHLYNLVFNMDFKIYGELEKILDFDFATDFKLREELENETELFFYTTFEKRYDLEKTTDLDLSTNFENFDENYSEILDIYSKDFESAEELETLTDLDFVENYSDEKNDTLKEDFLDLNISFVQDSENKPSDDYRNFLQDMVYTDLGEVVQNETLNILWEDSGDRSGTLSEARAYCEELDLYGKSWRLPNFKELWYLAERDKISPAISDVFEYVKTENYWTDKEIVANGFEDKYYAVSFYDGAIEFSDRDTENYIRCISGETLYNSLDLDRNSSGVVVDEVHELMWFDEYSEGTSWSDAETVCDDKNVSGLDDWRLPEIEELVSIFDVENLDGFINSVFENVIATIYWSDSTNFTPTSMWSLDLANGGYTNSSPDDDYQYSICIRDTVYKEDEQFEDVNLEECVGDNYTITELDCRNWEIDRVAGIEILTNLTELDLQQNFDITDVSRIGELTNLQTLEIAQNSIEDISSFSNLTKLTFLDADYNNIEDVSSLSDLNLTELNLDYNQIDSLDFSNLLKLETLNLNYNDIVDISNLSGFENLQFVGLDRNDIIDISPLSDLEYLETINVRRNEITTLTLDNLPSLSSLDARYNEIVTLELSNLDSLETLKLSSNSISDISEIGNLTNLETLYLDSNNISDISPLLGMENLRFIYLQNNSVSETNQTLLEENLSNARIYF